MILVRDVLQAKYGKGDELVVLFKEVYERYASQAPEHTGRHRLRLLTALSGPFFTVVTETVVESLAAWERGVGESFAHPEFAEWFARMAALVESGRREFYRLEAET